MNKPLINLETETVDEFLTFNVSKIEPEFESSGEAIRTANEIENILADLKVMRTAAAQLDSVIDTLYKKSRNKSEFQTVRYVLDEVLTEDTGLYNVASDVVRAIDIQIARYEQFHRFTEASACDLGQDERDTARYGSHSEQVRSYYESTR